MQMKTLFFLVLFTFALCPVNSQTLIHIKHKQYEGTIFSKQHDLFGFPPNANRYSPSEADVESAEHILSALFDEVTSKSKHSHYKRDVIKKRKLKRYYRLYWGELDEDGSKIVGIIFDSNYKIHKKDVEELYSVLDGGSSYFIVKINISKKKIESIMLNGYS